MLRRSDTGLVTVFVPQAIDVCQQGPVIAVAIYDIVAAVFRKGGIGLEGFTGSDKGCGLFHGYFGHGAQDAEKCKALANL